MTPAHWITVDGLRTHLADLWGTNRQGTPNLTTAAHTVRPDLAGTGLADKPITYATFGVSPATVRTWIRGPGHHKSPIPAAQLAKLYRPDPDTTIREREQKRARAEDALTRWAAHPPPASRPENRLRGSWWDKGWYAPHLVTIVSLPPTDDRGRRIWRQVITSMRDSNNLRRRLTGGGRKILHQAELPTYWHAQIAALEVMDHVGDHQRILVEHSARQVVDRTWDARHVTAPDLAAIAADVLHRWPRARRTRQKQKRGK